MTDLDRDGPHTEQIGQGQQDGGGGSLVGERRQFPTSRRAFVGILGAVTTSISVGSVSGTASADEAGTSGFGVGGYGEGGFGVGGHRTIEYYAGDDGVVRASGLTDAITDWKRGVIDMSLLLDVIRAWRSGEVVG